MCKTFAIMGSRSRYRLAAAWIGIVFSVPPAHAALSYDEALAQAETRAPELTARRAAITSAERLQTAADSLPDPKLVLGLDNVPIDGADAGSLDRDFMTMRRIGVMQEWPNAAKRRARADIAAASAEREHAQLAADRLTVRRETATAWLNRYYLEQRLALLAEMERENELLVKTTQAQLAGGEARAADTTMARQETVAIAERRDDIERQLVRARAALARYVGPQLAGEPLAGELPRFAIDAENLRTHLYRHSELAVFEPMAAQAAAETRAAQAERRPDWSVELAYQKRGPAFSDMASLQFAVDLPLFTGSRQTPRIGAKLADEARIAAERETMLRKHTEDLEGWLADHAALQQKLARTRDTAIPLGQEKLDLLLAAYRAGKGGLAPVLAARRELIETRMKALDFAAELDIVSTKLAYLYVEDAP